MRLSSYLTHADEFESLVELGVQELIIAPKVLSRKGKTSIDEIEALAQKALKLKIRLVLEWDILVNEQDFDTLTNLFKKIDLSHFSAIRCQDPGVLEFLLETTNLKIQWITEHGNHNLLGLQSWESYIGERLERLIVSQELSFQKLQEYEKKLKTPMEILGLGKILLFYTPRSLLSPVFEKKGENLEARADSEESPHKGFYIVENRHGSFMYHLKDRCLLNEVDKLKELSGWVRIEHLFLDIKIKKEVLKMTAKLLESFDETLWDEFKQLYPVGLTKGFFLTNKTDVLFPKLKNYRLLRSDESYIGEVVDVVKGEYIVFLQRSRSNLLRRHMQVHCSTPEGKDLKFEIKNLQNLDKVDIEQASEDQLVLIPYRKTVVPKSVFNLV